MNKEMNYLSHFILNKIKSGLNNKFREGDGRGPVPLLNLHGALEARLSQVLCSVAS
jgi:hypothetical protein